MTGRSISILSMAFFLMIGVLYAGNNNGPSEGGAGKDDVETIHNPKEPLYRKGIVHFTEDLHLEMNGYPYDSIGQLLSLEADESGNIFLLDMKAACIHVLDKKGTPLRVIGKKGQGPGEFGFPTYLYISPKGELFVNDMGRISVLSLAGRYLRGYTNTNEIENFVMDESGDIYGVRLLFSDRSSAREVCRYDRDFRAVQLIETWIIPKGKGAIGPLSPQTINLALSKTGHVIVAPKDRYELRIYGHSGSLEKLITKDHDILPVTERYKERMLQGISKARAGLISFPDYFPPINRVFYEGNDHIFVETHEEAKNGSGYIYDIFDMNGRYLARTTIARGTVVRFKDEHVYLLEMNDDGYLILKRMRITWEN